MAWRKINFYVEFSIHTICWSKLGCKDGCTPDSVIKLGWEVNTRSIQEDIFSKICNGSLMTWWKPYCFVTLSTVSPSKQDLSRQYQLFDLTLKSPITAAKKGPFWSRSPKSFRNSQKNFQIHLEPDSKTYTKKKT